VIVYIGSYTSNGLNLDSVSTTISS